MTIQTNTTFFEACKNKLRMYLEKGGQLKSNRWDCLLVGRVGNDIQFYNGCDLIIEISVGTFEQNLETAVAWLLDGQKDPLAKFRK